MSARVGVARGVVWTTGAYAFSVIIRFGSNVVLARLLSPELFGILLIINTVRQGIELGSDVGLAQNVVQNSAGNNPAFYNTVWVMQIGRGILTGAILYLGASVIANLYSVPVTAFEISAAVLVMAGFASTSIFLLHRNMQLAKFNLFELAQDAVSASFMIAAAIYSPTVESLLIAVLLAQTIRTIWSFFLTPEGNQFEFQKQYAIAILRFGRWIFVASILAFLCANLDRLYIGKVAPLAIVGVYGIARALADVPAMLAARIGYSVIFPAVSSSRDAPREEVRARLSSVRFKLLLLAAFSVATATSVSDIAVRIIYDARYQEASWMLPVLLVGVWLAILCSINEYAMLGFGKPSYNVVGNGLKLSYYLIVLPLAFQSLGILGPILAISFSEIGRYLAMAIGSRRERFSFFRQDASATIAFVALVVLMAWLRSAAGFGTAFDNVPFGPAIGILRGHFA